MKLELSGMKIIGILLLAVWLPYLYGFFPIEAVLKLPVLTAYLLIMLIIGVIGGILLIKGKIIGLRFSFFATLMYIFFRGLDHTWALEHVYGALDNPTGNPVLDFLQLEYLKLKVLPRTEIPIQNKIFFYYQWGFMPIIQICLLFILPLLIFMNKNMPYNKSLKLDARKARAS